MEFSQRPTHSTTHPGAHGFMAAAPPPAHRAYAAPDSQQQQTFYATSPYMHQQQQQHAGDVYSAASRRLPSVSELLVSQGAAQQQVVAGHLARDSAPYAAPAAYSPASIPQKPFGIDVPQARSAHHYGSGAYAVAGHRDSESGSSVSSQVTLLGSYSPPPHQRAFGVDYKDPARAYRSPGDADCDQDEVYTAASILMSLRACKMPC
ncbi:hypothetical protein GGI01_003682 [Coemansia sp. RSA 376]|nr:hypothetical protein LPJ71_009251 [Coemansia sp. S17]KAJ2051601.1 hypothetical protein H4S04_001867 [Coemansia sp. S16]KAJ2259393.1 hypothetical protein GGI01_003682 [Coemansia sp. RSA 376]